MNTFKEYVNEVKKIELKDKVGLRKSLQKNKTDYLVVDIESGEWDTIKDKPKEEKGKNIYSIQNIRDYYGWRYNVPTSISVSIKHIERDTWDKNEVGRY